MPDLYMTMESLDPLPDNGSREIIKICWKQNKSKGTFIKKRNNDTCGNATAREMQSRHPTARNIDVISFPIARIWQSTKRKRGRGFLCVFYL